MSQVLLVVEDLRDWSPYFPSEHVITFEDYLAYDSSAKQRVRVINLCKSYEYLKQGYYCSLLAEAKNHHVIPSVRVINDLGNPALYQLDLGKVGELLAKNLKNVPRDRDILAKSFFGNVQEPTLLPIARALFERFPCPIISFRLHYTHRWELSDITPVSHDTLSSDEETAFADALDAFCAKIWRERKPKKTARYDLAILVNPEETLPPSNKSALTKFVSAGRALDVNVTLIHPEDFVRLPEFDALFIRETTAISHHTYRFAKKAESEGLVVIDDPTSILRCTNKIYLAKLFEKNRIPCPRTHILRKGFQDQLENAVTELGLPLIIKIPDGAFSKGIVKVKTHEELLNVTNELFEQSSLLIAQEFLYTDFDWRIGVLNNKPLYACRYYMVKNHWQIYLHGKSRTDSGRFDTLATHEVPKAVLQAALKATKLIGNGFYGVDVKQVGDQGYVIEINDNPNIDAGVEDLYLGKELYQIIMQDFIARIEAHRHG